MSVPKTSFPLEPLLQLLAVDTTTGNENAGEAVLARLLPEDHRLQLERLAVGGDRHNLLWSTEASPRVLLTTHYDTVPPFHPPRLDGDLLWGRGTCDAKGILFAMLWAARRVVEAGEPRVAVLAVVGEETHSDGAKAAVQCLAPRWPELRYVVDGEPTDNRFLRGALGVLGIRLETLGTGGHSAYPERGASAVHRLLDALDVLRQEEWPDDEDFGPTTVNVGRIEGGDAVNVLGRNASAELMFRVTVPASEIAERVTSLLGELPVSVEVTTASDPMRFHVPVGEESDIARFGSDLPYLQALGKPVLYGPGSIHVAHTDDEHVQLSALEHALARYESLTRELVDA